MTAPKPKVAPARALAFDVLLRVRQSQSFASDLLHADDPRHLSRADHGLATELVMGTLRWRSWLDIQIAAWLSQPLARLDAEILTILELGAYQLLFLDRVPAHAAIHESVELAKLVRKRSAASLVNAVLRRISEMRTPTSFAGSDAAAAIDTDNPADTASPRWRNAILSAPNAAELAQASSHPLWMVERWVRHYGMETARHLCARNQTKPNTTFFVRNRHDDHSDSNNGDTADLAVASQVEVSLAMEGICWEPGELLSSARRLRSGDLNVSSAFRNHSIAIQDEGSCLVALLLGKGKRILDCCAAPGGKTAVLAERNPLARIVACDLHPHRALLTRERVAAENVSVMAADATRLPLGGSFDRILVDAPCSGTGTLGRNPEIKWSLTPGDLQDLHQRQVAILVAALRFLAPGGRLIYSTCSLEAEENEEVVAEATRAARVEAQSEGNLLHIRDLGQELVRLRELGELARQGDVLPPLTQGPYLQMLPGIHPCDGFFAALIERDA